MFDISEKLKKYRNNLGLSQTEVAEKIDITKPTYAGYEKGKDISIGTLKKLANLFNVPFESFFDEDDSKENIEMLKIPILSDVSAGYGKEALEEATHWIKLPSVIAKNADFGTFVSGDSMEPKINDGDLLLVQNIPQLDSGMIGIFLLNDNVFCKRYHYNPITKETVLKSLNLNYKPIIVTDDDDFRIVGKVVGIYDYTV
jgi:repressor LexA